MKSTAFLLLLSLNLSFQISALAGNSKKLLEAVSENNFNELLNHKKDHSWIEHYIIKLLKTDLEFANSMTDSNDKLKLLKQVLEKTSFAPTKIQVLQSIADLQKKLKLDDQVTQKELLQITSPIENVKDCKGFYKKGSVFRDLRKFDTSLDNYNKAFKCYTKPKSKIRSLEKITLTQKIKHRGKDFLAASLNTYNFTKDAFKEGKIPAKLYNKVGIEHVRAVWTYQSAKDAMTYLGEMKQILSSKHSLQTVYWIYARLAEEKNKLKKSQKYLALALKEKPISDGDLIDIYWQKFWNHLELKQMQEAENALNQSLSVGDPFINQSRTYYWLINTLKTKKIKLQGNLNELNSKKNSQDKIKKSKLAIEKLDQQIDDHTETLTSKYPISFYTALIRKHSGYKYEPSDLDDFSSKTYKKLPKSFDLEFYKKLQETSTLATQSFLRKYYYKFRRKISKSQRFLIKRLLARNGETTELFIELEANPEICFREGAPCMDLFPTPYQERVTLASKRYQVPKELIYSIIRQESIFNPLAKSWADARGLMQLLPSIAKSISKDAKVEYSGPLDLYSVEKNIYYGTYLIKSLIQEMDNSLVMGLCGYNAEKRRAKTWYKTRFKGDWLKFIEEIPYNETRNYNKLVLRNFLIYSNNDDLILKSWFPKGV